ncbi:MAG TPA: hypothetical protein VJ865_11370 [Gemmatimonadaceae bacterium]|nr:hypothetical protein [Gemmatimonadaceae bacterium]
MAISYPSIALAADAVNYVSLFALLIGARGAVMQPLYGRFLFTNYDVRADDF